MARSVTIERSDRRTVNEILARYELEPLLRDVFVEGPSDRVLLELAFRSRKDCFGIRAYEVDTVDVPSELLEARSLGSSNKNRILALADELAGRSRGSLRGSVVCLADRDFDEILGTRRDYELVVYTSHLSLDGVLISRIVLDKLFSMVLLGFPQSAETFMGQLLPVLEERVLQRLAATELGLCVTPPKLSRVSTFDGRRLSFEGATFVKRFLEKANAVHLKEEFKQSVERHRREICGRGSRHLHVEDYVELLHHCARSVKPRLIPEYSRFRRFLFGLVDAEMLAELPEIQEIASRLGCVGIPTEAS